MHFSVSPQVLDYFPVHHAVCGDHAPADRDLVGKYEGFAIQGAHTPSCLGADQDTGCGRIDGFIDLRGTLRVTDAAAGILICTEAGGSVSDLDGDPLVFPDEVTIGRCMVATNGVMHRKVIEYLR